MITVLESMSGYEGVAVHVLPHTELKSTDVSVCMVMSEPQAGVEMFQYLKTLYGEDLVIWSSGSNCFGMTLDTEELILKFIPVNSPYNEASEVLHLISLSLGYKAELVKTAVALGSITEEEAMALLKDILGDSSLVATQMVNFAAE